MNKINELYKNYEYYINYAILISISGITSVLNYISSIYVNRNLSISDFAYYNGIINIHSIIVLTISSFSYYIMHNYEGNEDARKYWAYSYIMASIIFAVFTLSIPMINLLFNIKNYAALLIISVTIFINVLVLVSQSILKINDYIAYDYAASLMAVMVAKIILLAFFIITGLTLEKATICILAFCAIYFIIHILELKKKNIPYCVSLKNVKKYFSKEDLSIFKNYMLKIIAVNFIFNWISLSDVLMANRYLDKIGAGYYSTMALIIKMFYYIGTPIATVMFSYILIARKNGNKDREKKIPYYSIILFALASLFLSTFLIVFAKSFILMQFTSRYEIIIPLVPKAAMFGFSLGFSLLAFNYGLAYKLFYPFLGYLIIFAYVYFSLRNGERTFDRFIFVMTAFYSVLFIYNVSLMLIHRIFLIKKTL